MHPPPPPSTLESLQMTLDSIGDGVIAIDINGTVTYLNPTAERMTGWSIAEACGRSHLQVLHIIDGYSREPALNPLATAILHNRTATLSPNSVMIHRDGSETAIDDTAAPMHDESGELCGAVIVFRDVGATRARAMELIHKAQHDTLTDLPNRLLLNERMTQAMSLARRRGSLLAVLFLDVDRFKPINDSLGHTIGDQLLRSLAQRMLRTVRDSDTVSRHGGDEFIILLPEVDAIGDATTCAQNLLACLQRPHPIEPQIVRVTVSIGIALFPAHGTDAETLIHHADLAMISAKMLGGAQSQVFYPTLRDRLKATPD